MESKVTDRRATGASRKWLWITLSLLGVIAFVAANAHLIYVAIASQPECVAASEEASDGVNYRAAKWVC